MRDYTIFIPEYIAAAMAVAIIGIELFAPKFRKDWLAYVTAAGAAAWCRRPLLHRQGPAELPGPYPLR